MSWEVFRPRSGVSRRHPGLAAVTVVSGGRQIRLNCPAAIAARVGDADRVILLLDTDNGIVALRRTTSPNGFKVSIDRSGGALLSCMAFLRASGIPPGSYLAERFDDDGVVVVGFRFGPLDAVPRVGSGRKARR